MAYIEGFVLILLFTYLAGFNDGGNLLAAFLSTRSIRGVFVVVMILSAMVVAPYLVGLHVARTIGTQIVDLEQVGIEVFNVALVATLVTLFASWRIGMPTSITLALAGGLSGAGLVIAGPAAVLWLGVVKVATSLIFVVLLGGMAGMVMYALILTLMRYLPFRFSRWFLPLQYLSTLLVSLGYGGNDAEKSIGLMAVWLALFHHTHQFYTVWWVIPLMTFVFAIGLLTGGLRVAKTIGHHVYKSRPIHALATQYATAAVVLTAAAVGGPASTTQTIDSALVGVGARAGMARVRWATVRRMMMVWAFTMPTAFTLGAVLGLAAKVGGLL